MCHRYALGSVALISLGLGIWIGSVCSSVLLIVLLVLSCEGLGLFTLCRKK